MTVVLLSPEAEQEDSYIEMDMLRRALEETGAACHVVNLGEWPGDDPVTATGDGSLSVAGTDICPEDVTGLYLRPQLLFRPAAQAGGELAV